jgi:flagellin FlaB
MKSIINNEEAQAGVGTLIIFIAMVLVAAVAAAVLLQTSGVMQSKSTTTTKEAASAIAENIAVESVEGIQSTGILNDVNITIRVAAGGSAVDLSKVLLKVNGQNYNYTNVTPTTTQFRVFVLRQDGTSLGPSTNAYSTSNNPSLEAGALARVDLNVAALGLQQKKSMALALTPEKGATVNLPVTLPAFSTTSLSIYP